MWAKLRSYPAWPAQVLSPHVGHQAPPRPRPSCVLVHFFGTYDIQWVESEKKVCVPWRHAVAVSRLGVAADRAAFHT